MRLVGRRLLNVSLILSTLGCGGKDETDNAEDTTKEVSTGQQQVVGQPTQQTNQQSSTPLMVTTRIDLPDCEESIEDRLYFLSDENSFVICRSGNFSELDFQGEAGADGVAGAQGTKGDTGDTGPEGDAGLPSTAAMVYDTNSTVVGNLVTVVSGGGSAMDLILLANGGFARFNLVTGTFYSGIGIDSSNNQLVGNGLCHFVSNDCSGDCYWSESTNEASPMRNSLAFNGSDLFIVSGDEPDAGVQIFNSIYGAAGCTTAGGPYGRAKSFLMNTPYTMPNDLSLPLAAPLYFGTPASE